MFLAFWVTSRDKGALVRRDIWWWLVFPLAYIAYTLGRGAVSRWYPYGFVDASTLGYSTVALNTLVLAAFFVLFGLAVVVIDAGLAGLSRDRSR